MASVKSRLADMYHSAEHFLEDMPIAKAIGNVISNPTPQEVGAQVYNLGSAISESAREATKDPVSAALNYSAIGMGITGKIPKKFYRHSQSATGAKDVPWQMFSNDESKIMGGYGSHRFTTTNTEGNVVYAEDIKKDIKELFSDRPDIIESYQYATPDDLANSANPKNIVDSAELWDAPDLVQEIWDNILEPKGITAVETRDGIIVFDPAYIKKERGIMDAEEFLDQ